MPHQLSVLCDLTLSLSKSAWRPPIPSRKVPYLSGKPTVSR